MFTVKCRYLEPSFKKSEDQSKNGYQTEYLCKLKMGDQLKTRQINLFLIKRGFNIDIEEDSCNFYESDKIDDCPIKEWTYPVQKSQ